MTKEFSRPIDAFDQWCLRRILHIPYTAHITNEEVRRRTNQDPVTSLNTSRHLRLFGHITQADLSQDHHRALRAAINRLPADWQHPRGRPRRTWYVPLNLTSNHRTWAQLGVEAGTGPFKMASTCEERATWWWWWWWWYSVPVATPEIRRVRQEGLRA